jgi:hypothetical protein
VLQGSAWTDEQCRLNNAVKGTGGTVISDPEGYSLPKSRLAEYEAKRDFAKTAEPSGRGKPASERLRFVIQKHAATRLHYDLRWSSTAF